MSIIVFLGPSMSPEEATTLLAADYRGPVAQGDIYRATQEAPDAIAIIDGYFERMPAVWHKEILWALSHGIPVYGAASMGALRAAELEAFGMRPVGLVADAFLRQEWTDDDEVAVAHATAEYGYRPLSEALVNIRVTLRHALSESVISGDELEALLACAKHRHYTERTFESMLRDGEEAGVAASVVRRLRAWLPQGRIDQKHADAVELLKVLATPIPPLEVTFEFQHTQQWDIAMAHAGSPGGDISTGDLFEELKLADEFVPSYQAAVLRALAVEHARAVDERGMAAHEDTLRWFTEAMGLDDEQLEAWVSENGLDGDRLRQLAAEQLILDRTYERVGHAATSRILDHLRIRGLYAPVAERVRDKHAVLQSMGLESPSLAEVAVTEERLWSWFFSHRADLPVPEDIEGYARMVGFESIEEFRRAALREACYSGDLKPPPQAVAAPALDDTSRTQAVYRDAAAFIWSRTDTHSRVEGIVTSALIERWLPEPPARVADVGGGNGRRAFDLAQRGYEVHLSDVVPELIDDAREREGALGQRLADIAVADARALPYPDQSTDAVLLLGPLYHLTSAEARTAALAEALRVLRPGGVLLAQVLNRVGALRSVLTWHAAQAGLVDWARVLHAGRFSEDDAVPEFFHACYFHEPDEVEQELRSVGFVVKEVRGLDGPAPDAQASLGEAPEGVVRHWADLALELGTRRELLSTASHLLVIAHAPTEGEDVRL